MIMLLIKCLLAARIWRSIVHLILSFMTKSASWFVISYNNNNDKRDFKMDSNKTVNNVLDKGGCLFPLFAVSELC